jgi:hypothetical protein
MTFTGDIIAPEGIAEVPVELGGLKREKMQLYVVPSGNRVLFGRDWLKFFHENFAEWVNVHAMQPTHSLPEIMEKYRELFTPGLGRLDGPKAKLTIEEASSKFCKARSVPYSMKDQVEKELDAMEASGILSRVELSEWASPIVPVVKESGALRICGDFKITLFNPVLKDFKYPLPKIEDIFANLAGGQHFTKLDLKQAYLQMEVEETSQRYLTINTPKGLYRFNRLPFGIKTAPSLWQKTMDEILQGIAGVQVLLDDIIITGKSEAEHLQRLELVLGKLQAKGLKLNSDKCKFFASSVTYCGHVIDKKGLHKMPEKISAISEAPRPVNVLQPCSYLGLVNYYHRFLPNISSLLRPLNQLLEKDHTWKWTRECNEAFQKSKKLITSDMVLAHYSVDLPVTLAADASPYGIGCVISHVFRMAKSVQSHSHRDH